MAKRPSIDGTLVAQVTDLHIGFDRDNPHEMNVRRLNLVIDQLNAMRPKPSLISCRSAWLRRIAVRKSGIVPQD